MAQSLTKSLRSRHWLTTEKRREALAGYLFVLPTFIGYTAFVIGPILAVIGLSFTSYDILSPPTFNGLDNYLKLFGDVRFRTVYLNTIIFTVFAVIGNLGIGLVLALLLNRRMPAFLRYFFRSAYFFPVLIALVYCSIIWQFLYQKDTGAINFYLGELGIDRVPWLNSQGWALPSVIIMDVWKNSGFAMLIFLAGLQNISQTYYEAAQIDGANRFQILRRITLPLLTPTLFFNLIIFMIGGLQMFDSAIVLTGGGPGDASRSLVMYIYEQAFQNFNMGYSSAISITLFIVIVILTLIQFGFSKRWVNYD